MELPSHEALMSMSSRDREALRAVATPEQNATLDEYTTAREAAELKLGRNSGVAHRSCGRKPPDLSVGRNAATWPSLGYTFFWFSTYCLTTSRGAPPTVATK